MPYDESDEDYNLACEAIWNAAPSTPDADKFYDADDDPFDGEDEWAAWDAAEHEAIAQDIAREQEQERSLAYWDGEVFE